jgi:hypothetical protein
MSRAGHCNFISRDLLIAVAQQNFSPGCAFPLASDLLVFAPRQTCRSRPSRAGCAAQAEGRLTQAEGRPAQAEGRPAQAEGRPAQAEG